jgi:hypothetical protein
MYCNACKRHLSKYRFEGEDEKKCRICKKYLKRDLIPMIEDYLVIKEELESLKVKHEDTEEHLHWLNRIRNTEDDRNHHILTKNRALEARIKVLDAIILAQKKVLITLRKEASKPKPKELQLSKKAKRKLRKEMFLNEPPPKYQDPPPYE